MYRTANSSELDAHGDFVARSDGHWPWSTRSRPLSSVEREGGSDRDAEVIRLRRGGCCCVEAQAICRRITNAGGQTRLTFEMSEGCCKRNLARAIVVLKARCRECKSHARARFVLVIVDLVLQPADLRLQASSNARELANIHRVSLADAGRNVGDAPLGARRAHRHGVGLVRD